MQHEVPPLGVTMGEPAGIGGEILLLAWAALRESGPVHFAIDDPRRLERIARSLDRPVPIARIGDPREAAAVFARALPVLPIGNEVWADPGRPLAANGPSVTASIRKAAELALAGNTAGIVTNPIHKAVLQRSGFAYPGHTEYLAALAGAPRSVMMLAAPGLRTVPVTIHVPLTQVPRLLTAALIVETARIVAGDLQRFFAIGRPRLAVTGLNPHAGESGSIGSEEETIIAPAIRELQAAGISAAGPFAADSLFSETARAGYDAALCMFHDQALIPIKTLAMDSAVNVTLGLPFVRTSPDHGTAFDIAGTGRASAASLIASIRLAAEMSRKRRPS